MNLQKFLLLSGIALAAFSADAKKPKVDYTPRDPQSAYSFKRVSPTPRLRPYFTTAYTGDDHTVTALLGHPIHFLKKDTIADFVVNPTGTSMFVIEKGKKEVSAATYSLQEAEKRLAKFDVKKLGVPYAAVYMPDARTLAVATDKELYLLEPRKLQPVGTLPKLPFRPDRMVVSPNGYFLAAYGDGRVAVINLEQKTMRKELNIGEKITDVLFSPDAADMAVATADGVVSIYNTRSFDLRKMVDDLGDAHSIAYNFDGKYMAVLTNPNAIEVVNLLRDSERDRYPVEQGGAAEIVFIPDARKNTLMTYSTATSVDALRMPDLQPFYNQLIADETDQRLEEWLKMMPGETLEQYRERVTDETRARQRALIEYEITTRLAGDLVSSMEMNLGNYDRANSVLALDFDAMPSIFIPVPEEDIAAFHSAADLRLSDVLYGVNPDDSFEIVYATVNNLTNGKSYVYDNLQRAQMEYMKGDNAISLEVLQQQQMEEIRLMELREKVMKEAKNENIISDHTNIAVNSRLVPDYDADGEKILNYQVTFTYDVSEGFSAEEDFGPGKYTVDDSGAARSMLRIVQETLEGDMAQYLAKAKKLRVTLTGTADGTPIVRGIPYDGSLGTYDEEPVYIDGQLTALSVSDAEPIKENSQLAFLRALGVKQFLEENIAAYRDANKEYRYEVNVSEDKGSQYRRITADFLFVDAF